MLREISEACSDQVEFDHFVAAKTGQLNSCLEEWLECDLFFDEKDKAATMIFNPLDPIFELGPGETDAGKLSATITGLERSRKKLTEVLETLTLLPPPADRLVSKSAKEISKQLQSIDAALGYYCNVKVNNPERANVRAVNIAKAMRAAFERYGSRKLTATKTDGILTSHYCLAIEAVYEVLGLRNDAFEPARTALSADQDDKVYSEYVRLLEQRFNPETDFPFSFCKHSFEYVETNGHNCVSLNDNEEIQCLKGPANACIRR